MAVDISLMQQWLAGATLRVKKKKAPFAGMPLVGKVQKFADVSRDFTHTEPIDLTRARDLRIQEGSESLAVGTVDIPVFGRRTVGNDIGLALATFSYTDKDGDEWKLLGICAYRISGVGVKDRELKQVIILATNDWGR